jgi:hypothetical protein
MFNRKPSQGRPDLFVSAKTATAIPTGHPALRDALIQASLDPQVRSITYIPTAHVASAQIDLDAIVVERDDDRFLLDVVPARKIRDLHQQELTQIALAELGLEPVTLTTDELLREPRYTNAQLVWSYCGRSVPIGLHIRILQTLLDNGPTSLGELLKSVRSDRDPASAVMAMACADLVVLDIGSEPLGPCTIARSRS